MGVCITEHTFFICLVVYGFVYCAFHYYANNTLSFTHRRYTRVLETKLTEQHGNDSFDVKKSLKNYLESDGRFQFCKTSRKPDSNDLLISNKVWQYFTTDEQVRYFILGVYFDDRAISGNYINLFPVIVSPISMANEMITYSLLLWYKGLDEPVSVNCVILKIFTAKFWNKDNLYHYETHAKCPLPKMNAPNLLPTHVSVSNKLCPEYTTTLLPLTIAENGLGKTTKISACIKCLFGNLTKQNAAYVVSWFESLKLFGLSEVYGDEDLYYVDDTVKKIFQHYKDTGFLHMRKIPNSVYGKPTLFNAGGISQSVVTAISNDCFYRNMNRYKYLLHIDLDELPVPRKHNSYLELINEYLDKIPTSSNSTSLFMLSAPFYTSLEVGNPLAPKYVPMLQYTYRMPHEIPGQITSNGVRKAFQSTDTCSLLHIHGCGRPVEGYAKNLIYFSPSDILIHHYRSQCKYKSRWCPHENKTDINDPILWNKHGQILSRNVYDVLNRVGYFD